MVLFTRLFLWLQFIYGYNAYTITRYIAPASSLVTRTLVNNPEPTTFWGTDSHALTITARPTGVDAITTWTRPGRVPGHDFAWVELKATDFPNGELPTPTEELGNGGLIPTFAEVTTYTAGGHCPTRWTATGTQYIDILQEDWWVYIPRATSTVHGPVMRTTIYPISPTTRVDGPAIYIYTTTSTTINEAPAAAARTPGPMYYLPTGFGFDRVMIDLNGPEWYSGSWKEHGLMDSNLRSTLPADYADSCRHPTNLPPGPNHDWSTTNYEWELPYKHDFAEQRRRKLQIVMITLIVVVVVFIIGLFESWFWFGRLMTGRKCFRMGTWIWAITTVIGFLLIMSQTEWTDSEHREELAGRWKQMGMKQKLGLWLKWGFRWKYPVELLGDIREDPGSPQALNSVRLQQARNRRVEQEWRSSVDTLPMYVDTVPAYSKPPDQQEVAVPQYEEVSVGVNVEQGAGLSRGNGQERATRGFV